jgi:hypothetical protein
MKTKSAYMLTVVAVLIALGAETSLPKGPATSAPAEAAPPERGLEKVASFDFEGVPLADVLTHFRSVTGVSMDVDWKELGQCGVTPGSGPVTAHLGNVRAATALDMLLQRAAPDLLAFCVRDGAVIVTSRACLESQNETVVYDVGDLTEQDPGKESVLVETVLGTVDPPSWEAGGGKGAARVAGNSLVVYQNPLNQAGVKRLLDQLEENHARFQASPRAQAKLTEAKIKLVGNMKETCFDSQAMGIVAIGALRSEIITRDPEALMKELEGLLRTTNSRGLRNAIHLTLKDVYLEHGMAEPAKEHVKAMIQENDATIQGTAK